MFNDKDSDSFHQNPLSQSIRETVDCFFEVEIQLFSISLNRNRKTFIITGTWDSIAEVVQCIEGDC